MIRQEVQVQPNHPKNRLVGGRETGPDRIGGRRGEQGWFSSHASRSCCSVPGGPQNGYPVGKSRQALFDQDPWRSPALPRRGSQEVPRRSQDGSRSVRVTLGSPAPGKKADAPRGRPFSRPNPSFCTQPSDLTAAYRKNGGEGQNRTADTAIFSRVLYQLSYLALVLLVGGLRIAILMHPSVSLVRLQPQWSSLECSSPCQGEGRRFKSGLGRSKPESGSAESKKASLQHLQSTSVDLTSAGFRNPQLFADRLQVGTLEVVPVDHRSFTLGQASNRL